MIKTLIVTVIFMLACPAFSQDLPKYYPAEGFQRTGLVDAIYYDEGKIVINDIPYMYSRDVVVHSMSSYRVSLEQVRNGERVAYKVGCGGEIVELWLLPTNYSDGRQQPKHSYVELERPEPACHIWHRAISHAR